jgi:hypothetical protein
MKQKFYFVPVLFALFLASQANTFAQNTIFTISGPTSVCPGITYTYNLGPSGSCYSYFFASSLNWSVNGGTITGYNNTTLDKSSTIYVTWSTVSNANSITCSASTGASNPAPCNFTTGTGSLTGITMTIPVGAKPSTPSLTSDNASLNICAGQVITFKASSSFAYGGIQYVWYVKVNAGGYSSFNTTSSGSTTYTVPFANDYNVHDTYSFMVQTMSSSCNNLISNSSAPLSFTRYASGPTPDLQVCNNGGQGQVYLNGASTSGTIANAPSNYYITMNANAYYPLSTNANIVKLSSGSYPYQFHYYDNSFAPPKSVCMTSGTLTVNTGNSNPYSISISSTTTPTTCPTGSTVGSSNDGQIDITPSSSYSTSYTYSWSNSATTQDVTGLTPGSYNVTVTDQHTCTGTANGITVGQPTLFSVTPAVTSNYNGAQISCSSASDGQITVPGSGGTGTLNYSIDNGASFSSTNVFSSKGAGTYYAKVRDSKSCVSAAASVSLSAPNAVNPGTTTIVHPTCSGSSNGTITVSGVSGGTPPYMYSSGGAFQSSNILTVAAGTYTVTVRDANNCSATITNQKLNPAITASYVATTVTCNGGSDGSITITASGGNGSLTYSKDDVTYQASNIFSGLTGGSRTVYIKDGNGCKYSLSTTVPANPVVAGSIIQSAPVKCKGDANGALDLTPSGGVSPYTYLWSNGATTQDIGGIPTGVYSVVVTDSKNCPKTFNYTLTEPALLTTTSNLSDYNGFNVSCFGSTDGSIDLTVAGGTSPYTYAWSNASTSQDLSTIGAGHYTVNVNDSRACTNSLAFDVTTPPQLSLSILNTKNISCFGGNDGNISLNASGGTDSYQFSINSTTSWQTSGDFLNLTASSYTLRLKDTNNCQTSLSKTLTSPTALSITISNVQNTTCGQANGAATATASGGVSSYTYNWYNSSNSLLTSTPDISNLNAGVYHVNVTDQNGCQKQKNVSISSSNGPSISVTSITPVTCYESLDGASTISVSQGQAPYDILWPTGQTTATGTGLGRGDQLVQVSDATGCKVFQTVIIPNPDELTIQTITQQDPACFNYSDGKLEVTSAGGNGSYTYNWNTGSNTTSLQNLSSGTYSVTVKDVKGCEKTAQFTLNNPAKFIVDLGPTIEMCNGQTITIHSNTPNAIYNWTSTTGFTSNLSDITVNKPGTYTLNATNSNGCQAQDNVDLVINQKLLKTDFLMATEAHVGDTIAVIDISWPLPESTNWKFDQDATIIYDGDNLGMITFDTTGIFTIGLSAQLATCAGYHEQKIKILPAVEGGRVASTGLIEDAILFPNPSDGEFGLQIDLSTTHSINLKLVSLSGERVIFTETLIGGDHYERDYHFTNLGAGVYFLFITAGRESRMIRLVIL